MGSSRSTRELWADWLVGKEEKSSLQTVLHEKDAEIAQLKSELTKAKETAAQHEKANDARLKRTYVLEQFFL